MKLKLLLIILTIHLATARAQNLGAYTDYMNHFYIFDSGESLKVEDLVPQSFSIGGECVLYVNSQGNLCYYKNKISKKIENGGVTKYQTTDHMAAYSIFNKLKVVEMDTCLTLGYNCPVYRIEDSLIAFYDADIYSLRVYYKGKITDIESGLLGRPISSFSAGDNIVAYVSTLTNDFKIWYNGSSIVLLNNFGNLSFKAGRDIVAYVNKLDNTFHAYYKGNDYKLEDFVPKSYEVGRDFMAYVSSIGDFKAFYDGEVITITSYVPDKYSVKDNLVVFEDAGYFKVFWNGQVTELESYIPKAYQVDLNSVAYLDNTNRIWLFSSGEKKVLVKDMITSFRLYRDLIVMGAKVNRTIIYYKGKTYEGSSM
jgi:hypothetical protein